MSFEILFAESAINAAARFPGGQGRQAARAAAARDLVVLTEDGAFDALIDPDEEEPPRRTRLT